MKEYLDGASLTLLDSMLIENEDLTYPDFLREFLRLHRRDGRMVHQQNWEKCRLVARDPHNPTVGEWTRFQSDYLSKRSLVDDWTELGDREKVMSQIPPYLQGKVMREIAKNRRGQWWVRVSVPEGLDAAFVRRQLEIAAHFTFPLVTFDRHSFVVKCTTPHQQSELLRCHGAVLRGKSVKIELAESFMSGSELLEFVRESLRTDEEVENTRAGFAAKVSIQTPTTPLAQSSGRGVFGVEGKPSDEKHTNPPSLERGGGSGFPVWKFPPVPKFP